MFFKKNKLNQETNHQDKTPEGYVWVEGYKTTTIDMKNNNGFQLKINQEYNIRKISTSNNSTFSNLDFYFYRNLKNVNNFTSVSLKDILKYRYFKIKALVNINAFNSDKNQLLANKIIFTEEIPRTVLTLKDLLLKTSLRVDSAHMSASYRLDEEDLDDLIFTDFPKFYENFSKPKILELEGRYERARLRVENELNSSKQNLKDTLLENNFSELFCELVATESTEQNDKLTKLIKTLSKEQLSRDMFVYYILKEKE